MDSDDPIQNEPTMPVYPDTAAGTLARQRDELLRAAEADRGLAEVYGNRAADSEAKAAQIQTAIDAMPPDTA